MKRILYILIFSFAFLVVGEYAADAQSSVRSRKAMKKGFHRKRRSERRQKKLDWKSAQRANAFYHSRERRKVNKYAPKHRSGRTLKDTRHRSRKKTRKSYNATKPPKSSGGMFKARKHKSSKVR